MEILFGALYSCNDNMESFPLVTNRTVYVQGVSRPAYVSLPALHSPHACKTVSANVPSETTLAPSQVVWHASRMFRSDNCYLDDGEFFPVDPANLVIMAQHHHTKTYIIMDGRF